MENFLDGIMKMQRDLDNYENNQHNQELADANFLMWEAMTKVKDSIKLLDTQMEKVLDIVEKKVLK